MPDVRSKVVSRISIYMRKEIQVELDLEGSNSNLLDNHTFLNLFNILHLNIQHLSETAKIPEFDQWLDFSVDVLLALGEENFNERLGEIQDQFAELSILVKQMASRYPSEISVITNVMEVIETTSSRLSEFQTDRYQWVHQPVHLFEEKLFSFLAVTERVSKNRFRFTYAPDRSEKDSYHITLNLEAQGETLYAPPLLHDVIRDLTANARKYSEPGSHIQIHLSPIEESGLQVAIEDTGIGIPENEILRVVEFGYRASNASELKTMGGGFGLTKAYCMCKRFNGRFFIESEVDRGTRVEFTIHPPYALREERKRPATERPIPHAM